jgi:hypothetical protein
VFHKKTQEGEDEDAFIGFRMLSISLHSGDFVLFLGWLQGEQEWNLY